jgi:hypothetical protein
MGGSVFNLVFGHFVQTSFVEGGRTTAVLRNLVLTLKKYGVF